MVLPVLLLQWWFAGRMDRTLPKRWRRLPTLSFYGNRSAAPRQTALYDGFRFTLLMCAMLIGLAIWVDFQPRAFAAGKTIVANVYGLAPACLYYGMRVFLIRRWVRTGKPRIHGLRHPRDDSA